MAARAIGLYERLARQGRLDAYFAIATRQDRPHGRFSYSMLHLAFCAEQLHECILFIDGLMPFHHDSVHDITESLESFSLQEY